MGCTGAFATAIDFNRMMCAGLDLDDPDEVANINAILELAASDLHVAMAAAGACDCDLAPWALQYLKKLNVVDAAVIHNCNCSGVNLSEEERLNRQLWLERQLDAIASGKFPLCAGDTGKDVPAVATAELSWTSWNQDQILVNAQARKTG